VSVLVDRNTRVIVQGMGKHGTFHAMACRKYGTNILGGITPGEGGPHIQGFPMITPVQEAERTHGTNWSQITDTSQPYYPSETDPQAPGNMRMLEVPDNGAMIDYVSTTQMNAIFDANFNGTPLEKSTTLMMGFHPAPSPMAVDIRKVDEFLTYADPKLATKGTGPVVYISLKDVTKAFPAQ